MNGLPACCVKQQEPESYLEINFHGILDDDFRLTRNGLVIEGRLKFFDYSWNAPGFSVHEGVNDFLGEWFSIGAGTPDPANPYPANRYVPITKADLRRRVGWYIGNGECLPRVRYYGNLQAGDVIGIDVYDGGNQWATKTWDARLVRLGREVAAFSGGVNASGGFTEQYIANGQIVIPAVQSHAVSGSGGITACCLNDFAADDTPPVPPVPPPVPRLDITAVPDGVAQAVYLSWRVEDPSEAVNDATLTEYRIYRDGNLIASGGGQEYLDNSPPWGDLGYIVQAYTADGVWRLTGAVTARLAAVPPPYYPALPAPDNVTAMADNDQQIIVVSWSGVFGAASYNVLRATNPDGPYTLIANTAALTVSDATVQRGVTYYYKVQTVSEPASTDEPPMSRWAQAELYRVISGLLAEQVETYYDDGEPYTAPMRLTDEDENRLVTESSDDW